MSSLSNICHQNIVQQIANAPPMIQELVIDTTLDTLREKAEKDAYKQLNLLPDLVVDVLDDIFRCMSSDGEYRVDYFKLYPHVPHEIMKYSIAISEAVARVYQDRLAEPSIESMSYSSYGLGDY